jgi:hypothetical protein
LDEVFTDPPFATGWFVGHTKALRTVFVAPPMSISAAVVVSVTVRFTVRVCVRVTGGGTDVVVMVEVKESEAVFLCVLTFVNVDVTKYVSVRVLETTFVTGRGVSVLVAVESVVVLVLTTVTFLMPVCGRVIVRERVEVTVIRGAEQLRMVWRLCCFAHARLATHHMFHIQSDMSRFFNTQFRLRSSCGVEVSFLLYITYLWLQLTLQTNSMTHT